MDGTTALVPPKRLVQVGYISVTSLSLTIMIYVSHMVIFYINVAQPIRRSSIVNRIHAQ